MPSRQYFVVATTILGTPASAARMNAQSPELKVEKDIAYGIHDRQKFDLSMSKSSTPTPLIVWVHGGGWEAGNKGPNHFDGWVTRGYAVASINYRYSQHAVFPAQIHDVKAAGVEHELIVVAGVGHDSRVFNKETSERLTAFFDKHLQKH